jgi:hypothetical protein
MKSGEGKIQTDIVTYLAMRPDVAWVHVTTSGKFKGANGSWYTLGFPGLADIVGQHKTGRIICIEVKRPKEKPTDDQYRFLYRAALHGAIAFWVDSLDQVAPFMKVALECTR